MSDISRGKAFGEFNELQSREDQININSFFRRLLKLELNKPYKIETLVINIFNLRLPQIREQLGKYAEISETPETITILSLNEFAKKTEDEMRAKDEIWAKNKPSKGKKSLEKPVVEPTDSGALKRIRQIIANAPKDKTEFTFQELMAMGDLQESQVRKMVGVLRRQGRVEIEKKEKLHEGDPMPFVVEYYKFNVE